MNSFSLRLLFLAAMLASCGGESSNSAGGDGGGDGADYVPAPRGSTRPQAVPGAAVDCEGGDGKLSGRFIAPNGKTPVAGAFVYFSSGDCWAGTDKDGRFTAKGLPPSATQVRAEKGLFRAEKSGTPGGAALSLTVDPSSVRLAYVQGMFDTVQEVLERIGFEPERIDEESLTDEVLSEFDAVFLNCGLNEIPSEDEEVQQALRRFVTQGGVLYASDWAEVFVTEAFPGRVHFLEGWSRVGAVSEQQADVIDEGLRRALGKSKARIEFDAPGWSVIDSVAAGTQVLVRGPVETNDDGTLEDRPYMVQFTEGKGRVTYTTFHNGGQLTKDMEIILEQILFQL